MKRVSTFFNRASFVIRNYHSSKILLNVKKLEKSTNPSSGRSKTTSSSSPKPPTEEQSSSDPWKILIKKLDTSNLPKAAVGKVSSPNATIAIDELKCPHFGVCSGCTMKGSFTEAPIIRRASNFFQQQGVGEHGIKLNIHSSNITSWRTNVKLAVQPMSRWGGLKIGTYVCFFDACLYVWLVSSLLSALC